MHRFFCEKIDNDLVMLLPDESYHARVVLRLKEKEEIAVVLDENLYQAEIVEMGDNVKAKLLSIYPSPEPHLKVTIYQGIPKGDKMDFLVQKCTEAGVHAVVPVEMMRCVKKLDEKSKDKMTLRMQKIALEAAKQSGRTHVPTILKPLSFKGLLERVTSHDAVFMAWEEEKAQSLIQSFKQANYKDVAIIIGPEGGIDQTEATKLTENGVISVTLGKRILRTETAGLVALIMLLTVNGDYE